MEYKDYYQVLGVKRDANQDDIKRAYRKLARKYHPDVSKETGAEDQFKDLGEAYEVLKDPEKRAAYDQLGQNWQGGQDFRPPPDWDAGFEFSGGGFTDAGRGEFSDFFENLFGGGFRTGGSSGNAFRGHDFRDRGGRNQGFQNQGFQSRGEDHHAKILIDLEDSFSGSSQTVSLRHPEVDERGQVQLKTRTLNVKIPQGIKAGQNIRLAGQGEPGNGGGPAGDLYLQVEFKPHKLYTLDGRDLYIEVPLAPWEAALGAQITLPTPSGKVDLKIPANSKNGRKLRLKGRGLPGKPAGDLYAQLSIALPPADTEQAKELYRKMRETCPFNPRAHLEVST